MNEKSILQTLCYVLVAVYGCLSAWSALKLLQLWRASAGLGVGRLRCCGAWSSQRTLHLLLLFVGMGACGGGLEEVALRATAVHYQETGGEAGVRSLSMRPRRASIASASWSEPPANLTPLTTAAAPS